MGSAEVCRACLCACSPDGVRPLFSPVVRGKESAPPKSKAGSTLAETLAEVTRLQVHTDDDLPNSICSECHDQLCHSQKFIKKARESYYILCSSLGKNMNGDINFEYCSTKTGGGSDEASKPANSEVNCEDICDEMGITIENELKIDESATNFRGDISIIYSDKAIQVNLMKLDDDKPTRINGIVDCDVSSSRECLRDNDGYLSDGSDKIIEHCIKQEPEEYYDMETYNCIPEDHILTAGQIKIEPLSENDALKFHHGSDHQNSVSSVAQLNHETKNNSDCENFEVEYLDEDIKPTLEELLIYEKKMSYIESDDTLYSDVDSLCSCCGEALKSKEDLSHHRKLHKTAGRICVLCNKCFKTRKRLKRHVISQHSYYEFMRCDLCNMSFMNSLDLNIHKCAFITEKELCSLCNTEFDSKDEFKSHLSTHKEIVLLKRENYESLLCSKCNEVFESYSELFSHLQNKCVSSLNLNSIKKLSIGNENNKNASKSHQFYSCHHCNETFLNMRQLSSHIRIVHSHMSLKIFKKSFDCYLCMNGFKRKGDLKRHLLNVHKVVFDTKNNQCSPIS